jgi:hypothetical protein
LGAVKDETGQAIQRTQDMTPKFRKNLEKTASEKFSKEELAIAEKFRNKSKAEIDDDRIETDITKSAKDTPAESRARSALKKFDQEAKQSEAIIKRQDAQADAKRILDQDKKDREILQREEKRVRKDQDIAERERMQGVTSSRSKLDPNQQRRATAQAFDFNPSQQQYGLMREVDLRPERARRNGETDPTTLGNRVTKLEQTIRLINDMLQTPVM